MSYACHPSKDIKQKDQIQADLGKMQEPMPKIISAKWTGGLSKW
jgi:hypothetical protein